MRQFAMTVDDREAPKQRDDGRRVPAYPNLKGNVLIVDSDEFLVDMLERGLSLSRPRWAVLSTRHPSEAIEVLTRYSEFDAMITELVFDGSAELGATFIREVGQRWPEITLFVMTHHAVDDVRSLDAAEYIAKPPDMDVLVSRIDRAIRRQRESWVRGIGLATFVQILELEKRTCTVLVSHAGHVGEICLRDGRLVQVRLDGVQGKQALFDMLSWREHGLRVIDRCEADTQISASLGALLVEWSILEDHSRLTPSRGEDE